MTTHPPGSLTVTTPSPTEIAMSRVFNAPRDLVFDAFTRPELVKRWLGVFKDWTLPVCEIDLRVGGKLRYEWHGKAGAKMGLSGTFKEVKRPERIVHTEQFDDPWYEGEAITTTTFAEKGGKTTVTMTIKYSSQATRDNVLKSGMNTGVEASFNTLAEILGGEVAPS